LLLALLDISRPYILALKCSTNTGCFGMFTQESADRGNTLPRVVTGNVNILESTSHVGPANAKCAMHMPKDALYRSLLCKYTVFAFVLSEVPTGMLANK